MVGWERYALRNATAVICAYRFPTVHARWAKARRIEVIYNRIDTDRFHPTKRDRTLPLRVICVCNHIPSKNQENLIRAVGGVAVELTFIGQGVLLPRLKKLARDLGVSSQITFIESVPNRQIHSFYARHDIYAMVLSCPGICIPVLEAMACGLPIILNKPLWTDRPEIAGETAILVENTPAGYGDALARFIDDPILCDTIGARNRKIMVGMTGESMEQREGDLYRELVASTAGGECERDRKG
jgi:glycosyltransferase involved in cell wall biosynthesis